MKPKGGIIKLMTPQGCVLKRIWLTNGLDRGDVWPDQKWDFLGTNESGNEFDVQIELTFDEDPSGVPGGAAGVHQR